MRPLLLCPICKEILIKYSSRILPGANDKLSIYYCHYVTFSPHSEYSAIYLNDRVVSACIILNVNGIDYGLGFDEKLNVTTVGKVRPLNKCAEYKIDDMCKINYIIPWNDVQSATNVISKIINLKVFY